MQMQSKWCAWNLFFVVVVLCCCCQTIFPGDWEDYDSHPALDRIGDPKAYLSKLKKEEEGNMEKGWGAAARDFGGMTYPCDPWAIPDPPTLTTAGVVEKVSEEGLYKDVSLSPTASFSWNSIDSSICLGPNFTHIPNFRILGWKIKWTKVLLFCNCILFQNQLWGRIFLEKNVCRQSSRPAIQSIYQACNNIL